MNSATEVFKHLKTIGVIKSGSSPSKQKSPGNDQNTNHDQRVRRNVQNWLDDGDNTFPHDVASDVSSELEESSDIWEPDTHKDSSSEDEESHQDNQTFIVPDSASESDSDSAVFPMLCKVPNERIIKQQSEETIDNVSKSKWDKKHSCKFCNKLLTKISAHMTRKHGNEPEIINILKLKKGSKERRRAWGLVLNEGDYKHNYNVLSLKEGTLIHKYRRSSKATKSDDSITCPFCKGLYAKKYLSMHTSHCPHKPQNKKLKKLESRKEGELLLPVPYNVSTNFFHKVMSSMNRDDVFDVIKNDSLIISFGERLYSRRDVEEHTANHVSGRIRELGRLVKVLRDQSEMQVSNLSSALNVENFDMLLKCVKILSEYDDETHQFRKGSLALRLGYSIKKCSQIRKADSIKNRDEFTKNQTERFDSVFQSDWYDSVSATASQSIDRLKYNKPKLLPSCTDVQKVQTLVNEKMKSTEYSVLTKATLCSITLFNRKRGGEVQRMKIVDFQNGIKNGISSDGDMLEGLSVTERKLVDYFSRIEIRGKFNRKVPILLTPTFVASIKSIINMRNNMFPKINSPYLFATPTGDRPYRGSDIIRDYAKEACVTDLSIFTSTHLRKQIATLSQTMEISKWEQDQLATFLGHDIRIHRNLYRQPSDVLQRAKVAKILLAVNKGIDAPPADQLDANDELVEDVGEHVSEESVELNEGVPEARSHPKKQIKRPWTNDEVNAVRRQLSHCITLNKVPRKDEAELALSAEPVLRKRTWKNVKDFIYNLVKKSKK